MAVSNDLATGVLAVLNRCAGTKLTLPPEGDIPLSRFGLTSFSTLSFIVDLERTFGIEVEEPALSDGSLDSLQHIVQYVTVRGGRAA